MSANIGTLDRVLRLLVGMALIATPFLAAVPDPGVPLARYGLVAIGAVLVLTAAFRFCPLYRVIGVRTCRT